MAVKRTQSTAQKVDAAWKVVLGYAKKYGIHSVTNVEQVPYEFLTRELGMGKDEASSLRAELQFVEAHLGYIPRIPDPADNPVNVKPVGRGVR